MEKGKKNGVDIDYLKGGRERTHRNRREVKLSGNLLPRRRKRARGGRGGSTLLIELTGGTEKQKQNQRFKTSGDKTGIRNWGGINF